MKIKNIIAREILDSRGNPTIETKIVLKNGLTAKASTPSGASTGIHEAWELRDNDPSRYGGKGVLRAVDNVNTKIAEKIIGINVLKQEKIDKTMIKLDGTENKKKLGANAILSVSLATARAASMVKKQELFEYIADKFKFSKDFKMPIPSFNIFNGGKHADTNLDFQEFMIMPAYSLNTNNTGENTNQNIYKSFAEMVRMGAEIFHELGNVLKKVGYDTDVGNEGGYAPDIISSVQALELIIKAIEKAGYKPGKDVCLGTDVGSSELYNKETKKYNFKLDQANFTRDDLIGLYMEWVKKYPMVSIEDGLAEDDWEGWKELNKELGHKIMLIGDDLFVTNIKRLKEGIKNQAANAVLIKPNQVGSLTETIECIKLAQKNNYKLMVSHRSGETTDDFIADLAVGVGAEYIKAGSLSRGERLAKYNRLMEIEDYISKIN